MNNTALHVLQTLCYSDVFNFPLTVQELWERCITPVPIPRQAIETEMIRLLDQHVIEKTGHFFHLPGKNNLAEQRCDRAQDSTIKLHTAQAVAQQLMNIPYVAGVFLTGAVAVENADATDDIDLLILTQPRSLWTARFLVTLWLEQRQLRRRPSQQQAADLICANLYLCADDTMVPASMRNLYTAHEVAQVKPLADPFHLHNCFLRENQWITTYLGNQVIPEAVTATLPGKQAPAWLEAALYRLQLLYMARRRTRERVDTTQAYFHPRDLASLVLSLYNTSLEDYAHLR